MKLLVTGGAGFIGSHFIKLQIKQHPQDQIVCLDQLTYAGNLENLKEVVDFPQFQFVQGNICDREAVYALFEKEKPEAVVNFAAESHVDRSIETPDLFLQTNLLGTGVLLDACRQYQIIRFHQVSTDEVYGDLPLDRPDLRFSEQDALCPSSPYAASKAAADLLALSYVRTYHLPVSISRGSNTYGSHQYPEKLIPLMVQRAAHGQPLPIYGSGLQVRDWIAVEDHCAAIDLILRQGKSGEVYNVGGGNERSNLEIVRAILQATNQPETLIKWVADRPGHDLRYALDCRKIEEQLGWKPRVSFKQGLEQAIQWYLM